MTHPKFLILFFKIIMYQSSAEG